MHMTPKTTDYRTVNLAWLRCKGARHIGYSGQITWRRRGEVTGSIGYRLESRGLRLNYRNTPYGGMPEDVDGELRLTHAWPASSPSWPALWRLAFDNQR
jgi:hypothetical protein